MTQTTPPIATSEHSKGVRGIDFIAVTVLAYVATEDGMWLAIKRAHGTAMAGCFNFVTGKPEHGEQPVDAVAREVREELGCWPHHIHALPPHAVTLESQQGDRSYIVLPFYVRVNSGDVSPNKREVEEVFYMESLDDMPAPEHPGYRASLAWDRTSLEALNAPAA